MCNIGFDLDDAAVACHQLGFEGSIFYTASFRAITAIG